MSLFDIIVGISFVVGIVLGFAHGAVRGLVGTASLLVAIFVALHGLPYTGPFAARLTSTHWLAIPLAMAIGFIPAYIAARLLGGVLIRAVEDTPVLGTLNRLIGAGFGFMRVLFLLGLFNIAFTATWDVTRQPLPRWIGTSAFYPMSQGAARLVRLIAPRGEELASDLAQRLAKPGKSGYDSSITTRRSPAR